MTTPPPPIQIKIFFMHRLRSCMKFAMRTKFAWERQAPVQPNVNAACNYNYKVFAPKQCAWGTYICACTCNWVAFIYSPPSHYCLIFHLCICKFLSSPWIRHHRHWKNGFDYFIQRFTPNLTRCNSLQILLLVTFHCQVLHKCTLPCILPILESRGKETHKAFGKSNAPFIAHQSFGSCGPI